jgi:hypothetical protein
VGGQLCTQVTHLALMGHLINQSDKSKLVLFLMASTARDTSTKVDPGTYWGGWEMLAKSLGYKALDDPAKKAVQRAIKELVEAGLVERLGNPAWGHRQVYRLTLPEPLTGQQKGAP